MVKRGKLEIIKDILKIIQDNRNSIKPTPLLRKSKMSSLSFKGYYSELMDRKLIREVLDEKDDKYITLTEKGFKFLERYSAIIDFIDEFEL
jgi:predicted transcriptional regulator